MISRRTFLAAGLLGATALVTARWLRSPHAPPGDVNLRTLDADAQSILSAVVPVFLAGALPVDEPSRRAAIADTVRGIDVAVAGLPPSAQEELRQLFALLALPPTRMTLARVAAPWDQAGAPEVRAFLDRFRGSSFMLLRSAYGALHQLTFAAYYGNSSSWPRIGYPGPPDLAA
ncbi:MAG: hypothetical protein ABI607_12220 [Betaproteobacteria bacterium]